jgi:hypothetical protein
MHEDFTRKLNRDKMTREIEANRQTDALALEKLKNLELKSLPVNFRYEFIDPEQITSIIVNAYIDEEQTTKLLEALRKHKGVIGYSIKDLKGNNLAICMH